MRLTLRTLLAHLDGVALDSGETSELAQKIDESEFVRNLVQRIRTAISRARLAAPKIDGQGLGHDANTVAAYLDNTLPQDRMPDLEKICLESDVLLSEVGACHQILSLVLQNPAKVSPRLRERVYRIGDLGIAPPGEVAAAKEPAAPPEPPPQPATAAIEEKPEPRKREIPEYLRETRSFNWKPVALMVVLGFLLAAGLLRALGPFDAKHPVLGFFAGGPTNDDSSVAQNDGASSDAATASTTSSASDSDAAETAAGESAAGDAKASTDDAAAATSPGETGSESSSTGDGAAAVASAQGAAASSNASGAAHPPQPPEGTPDATAPAPDTAAPTSGSATAAGASSSPSSPAEAAVSSPTTEGTIPSPIAAAAPPENPAPAAAAAAPDIGRYISENDVLARYQVDGNSWLRLPTNAPLLAGDRLLALPAYRPKAVLASGFQITLGGGTLVELRASEAGKAGLAVEYGRVVIMPVGAAGGVVQLDLWGRQGEITLAGATSLAAVHVRRYRSPGISPEAGLAHRMVEIFAVGGGFVWREAGQPEQQVNAGETFVCLDDVRGEATPTEQLPPWVETKDITRVDELAAEEMQAHLSIDLPLSRTLLELTEFRLSEVRALAIRSLTYLDLFEPSVDAFNTDTLKSYWDDLFNELQRALARSPESSQEVRVAFEKIRGRAAGAELYRMLWSYSPEDLAKDAPRLVDSLSHESLDFRVLAFENLYRITGETYLYRPEVSEPRRRTPANRWREALAAGKVVYADKVLMMPPRVIEETPTPPTE